MQPVSVLSIDGSPMKQLTALQQKSSLRLVVLTCGASGSILVNDERVVSELAAQPTTVVDNVGAGDAFTAAIAVGLLLQKPLEEIHAVADRVAAFVCTQPGVTPPVPDACRVDHKSQGWGSRRFTALCWGQRNFCTNPLCSWRQSKHANVSSFNLL
jgi:sugar/nucleoside kinase (ribokinase family)